LQKLINLVGDGFLRGFHEKEKILKQLRAEARLRGFHDISKLKKAQLKNLLSKPQNLDQLRKRNLLVKAKKRGIKNTTKLKKTQLVNEIDDKMLKLTEEKQSFFKGFTNKFTLEPSGNVTYDPESFLTAVKRKALAKIQILTKVKIILGAKMEKTDLKTGQSLVEGHQFRSKNEIILESTNKYELWSLVVEQVLEDLAKFQMNGSGWTFHSILALDIHTIGYEPLNGSSWVPLPKFLANKKAIINMKNTGNQCFKWCIAKGLNPVERDSERITKILKKQGEYLNFKGIEFPMNLKDIDKFERLNPESKVNVFGHEAGCVYALRISKLKREKKGSPPSSREQTLLPCQEFFKTCVDAGFETSWRN